MKNIINYQSKIDPEKEYPKLPWKKIWAGIAFLPIICALHAGFEFLLYARRMTVHDAISNDDMITFGLPMGLAIVMYAYVYYNIAKSLRWPMTSRVVFLIPLTIISALFSAGIGMFVSLNRYGS